VHTVNAFVQALESETKVKQVYVPPYSRKSSRITAQQVKISKIFSFCTVPVTVQGSFNFIFYWYMQGHVVVLGKDCDAYPNMNKYSWSQFKKYGR
jgi:hypothetical protein